MTERIIPDLSDHPDPYNQAFSEEIGEMTLLLTMMNGVSAWIGPDPETEAIALLVVRVNTSNGERVLKVRRTNTHWVTDRVVAPEPWTSSVDSVLRHMWRIHLVNMRTIGFDMISELWGFIRAWILMTVRAQPPLDPSTC